MAHTHLATQTPPRTVVAPCPSPTPEPPVTCCELICFERPRYFCGHLLTDADLSKEQQYVIEKHKLYHRTLHGHGVVCGLRLTCDPHCHGHILIGEGYAIDDCGNDLVVCESLSFDVLGRLREQGYLVESEPPDPCQPPETHPVCKVRQCFYVTVCYQEEQAEFTTPFVVGCRPTVSDCEATRIRESVRFDVVAELPRQTNGLDDLQTRIAGCAKLFSEGAFAQALKTHAAELAAAVSGQASVENHKQYCDILCELRGLLLLYLRRYPDKYNCTIEADIRDLSCPRENTDTYGTDIQHAFCRLLELAYQHVMSCIFGELVFPCPEPSQASCVVLGTVEVENGQLVRVCNCPRSYVWSFANFFEVLIATVLGGIACEADERKHTCCRTFTLQDCKEFVNLLQANERTLTLGSTAFIEGLRAVQQGLRYGFDFTRPEVIPSGLFNGMAVSRAQQVAHDLGVPLTVQDQPPQPQPLGPIDALLASVLKTTADPLVAFQSQGRIAAVQPELHPPTTLASGEREQLEAQIRQAQAAATAATQQVQALQGELTQKQDEIAALQGEVGQARSRLDAAEQNITTLLGRMPPQNEGEGEAGGPEGPEGGDDQRRRGRGRRDNP